jgi:hypothetical protein
VRHDAFERGPLMQCSALQAAVFWAILQFR